MSRTKIVHDPACQEPLNQHTGNESCLTVVEISDAPEAGPSLINYMQGVNGMKSDYAADARARYGDGKVNGKYPPLKSTMPDRRPKFNATEAGEAFLAERERARHVITAEGLTIQNGDSIVLPPIQFGE